MQTRNGQIQELSDTQAYHHSLGQNGSGQSIKEIPYDYVATFNLQGQRGNRVQDVINISTDGAFVAVSIGYSFIPAPLPALTLGENTAVTNRLRAASRLFVGPLGRVNSITDVISDFRPLLQSWISRISGIDFLYSIIDSATGRELQNLPIHNIAGLGNSLGERPFRPMAKPMVFQPRSTIRIEVEEISEGPIYGYPNPPGPRVGAQLYIVLHGYKMLGVST